jgi:hypothetical protein
LAPNYLITLAAIDLTDLDMWARAVPYGEFGRLRREAPVAVYEHFITGLTADVLDRMPPPGEAFDFVDAMAKEAHRVRVRPDPAP